MPHDSLLAFGLPQIEQPESDESDDVIETIRTALDA